MSDTTKAEFKKIILAQIERLLEPDGDIAMNDSSIGRKSPKEEQNFDDAIHELRQEFERRSQ